MASHNAGTASTLTLHSAFSLQSPIGNIPTATRRRKTRARILALRLRSDLPHFSTRTGLAPSPARCFFQTMLSGNTLKKYVLSSSTPFASYLILIIVRHPAHCQVFCTPSQNCPSPDGTAEAKCPQAIPALLQSRLPDQRLRR